jgi:hypothetical protein
MLPKLRPLLTYILDFLHPTKSSGLRLSALEGLLHLSVEDETKKIVGTSGIGVIIQYLKSSSAEEKLYAQKIMINFGTFGTNSISTPTNPQDQNRLAFRLQDGLSELLTCLTIHNNQVLTSHSDLIVEMRREAIKAICVLSIDDENEVEFCKLGV